MAAAGREVLARWQDYRQAATLARRCAASGGIAVNAAGGNGRAPRDHTMFAALGCGPARWRLQALVHLAG